MRILAFKIGRHHLGLPTDYVRSVGSRENLSVGKGSKKSGTDRDLDLARVMGTESVSSGRVINCAFSGKTVNLFVEQIVGLLDLDDRTMAKWPGILKGVRLFYGVGMANSVMYLLLDLGKIIELSEKSE